MECNDKYYGETSRNGHVRGIEHMEDSESSNDDKKEKSVILRHCDEKHNGRKTQFAMKIIKSYPHDPLGRQCDEALRIRNLDPSNRINDRKEYHQPGDVEVIYRKNENEEIKIKKKMTNKLINQSQVNKNTNEGKEENHDNEIEEQNKSHKVNEVTIEDFIRRMRNEKCDQCDFTATNKTSLKIHVDSVHEKRTYRCNNCDYKANDKTDLETHNKTQHILSTYQCDKCDYKAQGDSHLKMQHLCDQIEDVTSTQNMIKDSRIRRNLNGREINCQNCEYRTKSMALLTLHANICNKNNAIAKEKENNAKKGKRIYCTKCDKKFNKEQTYSAHMKKIMESIRKLKLKKYLKQK